MAGQLSTIIKDPDKFLFQNNQSFLYSVNKKRMLC